jgi:hypothetical protein
MDSTAHFRLGFGLFLCRGKIVNNLKNNSTMFTEKDLVAFGNYVVSDQFIFDSAFAFGFGLSNMDNITDEDLSLFHSNHDRLLEAEVVGSYTKTQMVSFARYMRSDERAQRIMDLITDPETFELNEDELMSGYLIAMRQVSDADIENWKLLAYA